MKQSKVVPIIEALAAVLIWGGSFIATKIALRTIQPATLVWLRFGMGVVILAAAVVLRRQWALPKARELGFFAVLGFMGITFHQWLQVTGMQTSLAITTAWIVASSPVFIALLGWVALRERSGWMRGAGIGLAMLGVLLVVTGGDIGALLAGVSTGAPGDFLILLSAVNWAGFSVVSRRALRTHPATRMLLFVMGAGWLFTTVWLLASAGVADVARLSGEGWLSVIFLGVLASGLAYIFWYDALQALPATQAGAFLYVEPLVAMVVAALILGESVTWASLVGGGVIMLGVWLVNRG